MEYSQQQAHFTEEKKEGNNEKIMSQFSEKYLRDYTVISLSVNRILCNTHGVTKHIEFHCLTQAVLGGNTLPMAGFHFSLDIVLIAGCELDGVCWNPIKLLVYAEHATC